MSDYSEIQKKIEGVVASYKQFYPDDYIAVVREVKKKQLNLKNKFGDMTKDTDILERPLLEIPETLFFLINKILSEDEIKFWYTIKGQHWFGKKYPEFLLTSKI